MSASPPREKRSDPSNKARKGTGERGGERGGGVETCPSFRSGHLPLESDLERLRTLTLPHVESFNYFLEHGLAAGIQDIEPAELLLRDPKKTETAASAATTATLLDRNTLSRRSSTSGTTTTTTTTTTTQSNNEDYSVVKMWLENVRVSKPVSNDALTKELRPRECRERRLMYSGMMRGMFCYTTVQRRNGLDFASKIIRMPKEFGAIPIMVLSRACHLQGSTPKDLVRFKEEQNEMGGYFIVNGIERCVRLLQVPRRNFGTAIQRSNYRNRGPTYTDLGVAIRCARSNGDQSTITNTVHYLTTGGASLRFTARKQEFLIPVVLLLRALSCSSTSTTSTITTTTTSAVVQRSSGPDAAAGRPGGIGITDEELYRRIVQGDDTNTFLVARAGLLLQDARARYTGLNTPEECLAYIGARFRRLSQRAETTSDEEIGHYMIRRYILIHLQQYRDKLECLLLIIRKLYSFAAGDCGVDNADSLQNQEILLPGHLLSTFVKEKFEEMLENIRLGILTDMRRDYEPTIRKLQTNEYWSRLVDRSSQKSSGGIGKKVAHFLSTGNIVSTTGLDLMQVSGYTIVAERLNFFRYCSHFRSVHRGQFFMEMKTTAVRKLLPDQWGFLCPVHTPDGGPCGLLSHLALRSSVLSYPSTTVVVDNDSSKTRKEDLPPPPPLDYVLYALGVSRTGAACHGGGRPMSIYSHLPVCLDGRVVGGASPADCKRIVSILREFKVQTTNPRIPATTEIALIPPGNKGAPYPGLYLFTSPARLVRPVLQRATGRLEYIGPLEQGFMDIACLEEDIREGITTHQELDPTNMLSLIANLTPFSDQNQSPRNMYQCQMGKQTMGTPAYSLPYRADNKLYRLLTPQAPLVQTSIHGEYKMDEYPNGTNAVIAVMSYTGFDMEDAMILNKASVDRGFAHATMYKTVDVDLKDAAKRCGMTPDAKLKFSNKGNSKMPLSTLDDDGLCHVGGCVTEGDLLYSAIDPFTNETKVIGKHKDKEVAYVQCVRKLGGNDTTTTKQTDDELASITLRIPRNPVIGDKFSSRHGQKGVLSIQWPQEDMPFTESGIIPDILFNPHGFPSRMTIGMLVESMAAKAGALHGFFQNGTPFSFHETASDKVSIDYFGEQLQAAGYNYYGSEPLYSGVSGCVMHADLYIGVVYYQRLRHMVSDKYQVRATGPTNPLTRQPIKGRKKGGGIRLGEMERDSLLSHGAAFLLQDRLLNCSDKHIAYVCSRCGDMLLPSTERCTIQTTGQSVTEAMNKPRLRLFCRNKICREYTKGSSTTCNDEAVEPIVMPYVYRYLVNELAAMNLGLKLEIK